MTTPNVEIAMPYGYTVGGAPDMYWLTRADGSTANVDLVPGPCRVMASWAGPERASFVLLHANGGKSVLDTIEKKAGGGHAILGWLPSALSRATRYVSKLLPAPRPTRPAPSRCTRWYPSSSTGGGVGDRASEHANGCNFFVTVQRQCRIFPRWIRNLFTALLRRSNNHRNCAQWFGVDSPVDRIELQDSLPLGRYGGREAGGSVQCRPPRRHHPLPVVLLQRRRCGFWRDDRQVLAAPAAGGGCDK